MSKIIKSLVRMSNNHVATAILRTKRIIYPYALELDPIAERAPRLF